MRKSDKEKVRKENEKRNLKKKRDEKRNKERGERKPNHKEKNTFFFFEIFFKVDICSSEFEKQGVVVAMESFPILDDFEDSLLLFCTAARSK